MDLIKSKKVILTLMAVIAITVATICIDDMERLRWFSGIIGGLIGSYNLGQGIADGISSGKTSSVFKSL